MTKISEILDIIAMRQGYRTVDLTKQIKQSYMQRKRKGSLHMRLSLASAVFVLTIITTMIWVPGVAEAVQHFLGFVPGLGVVRDESSIRILAEPTSQTREGITITVVDALLAEDKSSVIYFIEGIPSSAMTSGEDSMSSKKAACYTGPELVLEDGTVITAIQAGTLGYNVNNRYEHLYIFPSLPENINRASLTFDCIAGTRKGAAPEDWSIAMEFKSVENYVNVFPVVDVPDTRDGPMSLTQVIEKTDSYIIMGSFAPLSNTSRVVQVTPAGLHITDASGHLIPWSAPVELKTAELLNGGFSWAYEVNKNNIQWPIAITFDAVDVTCSQSGSPLHVVVGSDQAVGQIWPIDRDITVGDCSVFLQNFRSTGEGYIFRFDNPEGKVIHLSLEIAGYSPIKRVTRSYPTYMEIHLSYEEDIPTGQLEIVVADIWESVPGNWMVQWYPGVKE